MNSIRSVDFPLTLYLVGDSTMAAFPNTPEETRHGYGTRIQDFFDPSVRVVNLALSGRSSKSFLTEKEYDILLSSMKQGDYLAIAFGHNDEKPDPARHTEANLAPDDPSGFAYHLDHFYVQIAMDRGAHPILCTPIVRRDPEGRYVGMHVHRLGEGSANIPADYPQTIRDLAFLRGVTLVDMTRATERFYRELGPKGTLPLHALRSDDPSQPDNSHLSAEGACKIAQLWAETLDLTSDPLRLRLNPLRFSVKEGKESRNQASSIEPDAENRRKR
jgi:hypothetical protein